MKKILILLVLIVIIFAVLGCSSAKVSKDTSEAESSVNQLINATQFSRISPDELINIMGKAEKIDQWTFQSPNGQKYAAKTYEYNKGNYEFLVIDNTVVRFTFYGEGQTFQSEKDLFKLFGIITRNDMKKVADTGSALRYQSVSDKIGEFYVLLSDKNKIDTVKVTYNLNCFN